QTNGIRSSGCSTSFSNAQRRRLYACQADTFFAAGWRAPTLRVMLDCLLRFARPRDRPGGKCYSRHDRLQVARRYTEPMPAAPPAEPHLRANVITWADGRVPEEGDELVAVEVSHARWPGLAVRELRLEEAVFAAGDMRGVALRRAASRGVEVRRQ